MPSNRETPVDVRGKRIRCNLRQLMGIRNNMRIQELADMTGLRRNTISSLYHDKATRFDATTLIAICMALDITPGDLLEITDVDEINQN